MFHESRFRWGNRSSRPRPRRLRLEMLEDRRLLAGDFHNTANPADVNASGFVSLLDAIAVINDLRAFQLPHDLIANPPTGPLEFLDVVSNDVVDIADLLATIQPLRDGLGSPAPAIEAMLDDPGAEGETFNPRISGQIIEGLTAGSHVVGRIGERPWFKVEVDEQGNFSFIAPLPLDGSADGSHTLELFVQNFGGPFDNTEVSFVLRTFTPGIISISPANGEEMVNVTRETIVRFGGKVDPNTVNTNSFYLIANGEHVPGRVVVSSTNEFATFFFDQPLPPATGVRVMVDGDQIMLQNGRNLDGDGDRQPGGVAHADFRTLPLTRIPGTNIWGFLKDAYSGEPIVGATIRVDGFPEANAVTDENGRYELMDMPAPMFFVHIDGTTAASAPAGFMYPSVGKPFPSVPGQTIQMNMNGVPLDLFLPPMAMGDVTQLSQTDPIDVGFGAAGLSELQSMFPEVDPSVWQRTHVTIAPGAATDDQGNSASEAVIIPVPPDRLPGPLPPNLDPQLVISIQPLGATNFDVPAPVTFPNLGGLAPGEQALFFSFNHDSGQWEVTGTGTVTEDGLMIASDPGVGIRAPGWHFVQVGTQTAGQACKAGEVCVLAKGGRGDVIEVDLSGTGGEDFAQVQLGGGMVVYRNPAEDVAKGHFYFVPDVDGTQPFTQGTFTGTLKRINEDGQEETKQETGIVRVNIKPGYSTFGLDGSVGVGGENMELDVLRVQQRLRYLGFRGENNALVSVTGQSDAMLTQAIKLFQAAVQSNGAGNPANKDGRVDVGMTTHSWLNASNAPRWMEVGQQYRSPAIGNETWATSWTLDIVAGAGLGATVTSLTEYPDVGPTVHGEHKAGNDIDWDFVESNVPNNPVFPAGTSLAEMLSQLTTSESDLVDDIAAAHTAAGSQFVEVLIGGASPQPTYPRIRQVLTAMSITNRNVSGHHNHFHVSVKPPSMGAAAALADPDPSVFGTNDRIYYRFVLAGGVEIAGRTGEDGQFQEVLSPNVEYTAFFYQPSTNRSGVYTVASNASGRVTELGTIILDVVGGPDTDGDGLPDVGERAIGTDAAKADTDDDGIDDAAEITQGLDPLDDRGFPTGIISSLKLMGEARSVTVEGLTADVRRQTAYVATGSHGVAIVDASQFNNPVVLGQLDLPGENVDIAVDSRLQIAAIAAGQGGLHLVDVSDPMLPRRLRTIPDAAQQVEIVDGVAYAAADGEVRTYDLLTGEPLGALALPGFGSITGLARERDKFYGFRSGSDTFFVVEAGTGGQPALLGQTQASVASTDVGVAAGNGVAYLAGSGLRTIDISDPTNPVLLGDAQFFFTARHIALNGSGLGLIATEDQGLGIYDVSDPAETNSLLTRIDTPGIAQHVAIGAGIAFVADGSPGLHVINYLPFDNRGEAPTVTVTSEVADQDPNTPGIQIVEGSAVPIRVGVSDDVQVRSVELIVNGEVVRNDVSFPFDFSAVAVRGEPNATTVTVQARATDTGGNATLSDPLVLDLVPDTFAPMFQSVTPADGSMRGRGFRVVRVTFSEPMDAATLSGANIQLVPMDGGTPPAPVNIQVRSGGREVQLAYNPLLSGHYQVVLQAANLKDRAGNALESGGVVSTFEIRESSAAAEFNFQGTLDDDNGGPALMPLGQGQFVDDIVFGAAQQVYQFNTQQGLEMTIADRIARDEYSIEMIFLFDSVSGYRKIIDFENQTLDSGFYVLSGQLNFFPVITNGTAPAAQYLHVVLTRSAATKEVVAYVNGAEAFRFIDSSDRADVQNAADTLRFFVDDNATGGGESSSGRVALLRVYEEVLSPEDVAVLAPAE